MGGPFSSAVNSSPATVLLLVLMLVVLPLIVLLKWNGNGVKMARASDGVRLPYEVVGDSRTPLIAVVAHGLGTEDPSKKTHKRDATRLVIEPALREGGCRAVWYTARGHGESSGWERRGPEQFVWSNKLADDFCAVADANSMSEFVAIGNSMGAASALFAAIQRPDRVRALLLYRPPTMWETRKQRKQALVAKAEKWREKRMPQHEVLAGAALSDLPPARDVASWAVLKDTPTLILTHGNDEVHPLESGDWLKNLIPHATLLKAKDVRAAEAEFPAAVASWLSRVAAPAVAAPARGAK